MKIQTSFAVFKLVCPLALHSRLVALGIFILAASGAQSAFAGVDFFTLTLTERSSSLLDLAYDGFGGASVFSVSNTNPDEWRIDILSTSLQLYADFSHDFAEPEDPSQKFINEVLRSTDFLGGAIRVTSDLDITRDSNGINGVLPDGGSTQIGTDSGNPVYLRFFDKAQASEAPPSPGVPDSGCSLGMLAMSSIVLLGVSRLRFVRSSPASSCA